MKLMKTALAAAAAIATSWPVLAADISGAGATFPYPVYAKWADAYKKETGVGLNYQSIGSGGGIKQIKAKTVTFGASDMPLKRKDLDESGLIQFPTVIGGDVPVVNLEGITGGQITLDGDTLAKIFMGEVTLWDDPAIKKLNPNVNLPSQAIAVVHRSDGSGTTFIFTNYLSKVSKDWADKVGANTSVEWPTGIGAKGNEGVAAYVRQIPNSLGYVEYAYAQQNKMNVAALQNAAGTFVSPVSQLHVHHVEGAVARGGVDTAFGRRDAPYIVNVIGMWPDPSLQDGEIAAVRGAAAKLSTLSPGGAYLNFFDGDEGDERIRAAYGPEKYERLVALKDRYDPDNVFRLNQNIRPTGS